MVGRPLASLISGGKDSHYSLFISVLHGFDVRGLLTVLPKKGTLLFHEPAVDLVEAQARAMDMDVIKVRGWEMDALLHLFSRAKERWNIEWVSSGALASDFQRLNFVWAASEVGLKVYSPFWHIDPFKYMEMIVKDGFKFIILSSGVYELREWVGREISEENLQEFLSVAERANFNPAGEGGEYETFVTDSPLFNKRIEVKGEVKGGIFVIEEVNLVDKH